MPIRRVVAKGMNDKKFFGDNWPIRRRWMRVALIVMWLNAELILGYVLWDPGGQSNTLAMQAFFSLLASGCGIIFYYVFGAIWDDNNKMRHGYFAPSAGEGDDVSKPAKDDGEE